MITSDFTLEIEVDANNTLWSRYNIYPTRSKMPRQLLRLDVPEAEWHSVYDAAEELAERMHVRERGKARLKGFVVSNF